MYLNYASDYFFAELYLLGKVECKNLILNEQ